MKPLSPRRARFVQEYLVCLDPAAAAQRAGYKVDVQRRHAYWLTRQPEVAAAIREAQEERGRRLGLEADRVVAELMAIAFADIRNAATWRALRPRAAQGGEARPASYEVRVKDSADIDDSTAVAIAALRRTSQGGVTLQMHDKIAALQALGGHLGIFPGRRPGPAAKAKGAKGAGRRPAEGLSELDRQLSAMTSEQRSALRAELMAARRAPPGAAGAGATD